MRLSRFTCAPAVVLAGLLAVNLKSAAAAPTICPPGAGGSVALLAIDGQVRLDWIDARLSRAARRARIWTWGWGAGIIVSTAANLVPIAFVAKQDRIDWYTGAATTIVGLVPLLIAPLDVIDDARAVRERSQAARASGLADVGVCLRLADAEERMVRSARNQQDGQRWWLHAGNIALNTGVGLFLGIGYNHWGAGVFNALTGIAIGEAIILTQPTDTIADLRQYRSGDLGGDRAPAAPPPRAMAIGYGGRF